MEEQNDKRELHSLSRYGILKWIDTCFDSDKNTGRGWKENESIRFSIVVAIWDKDDLIS